MFEEWPNQKTLYLKSPIDIPNYQYKLTVHEGTGTDLGNIIFLSGCEADFSDVRFIYNEQVIPFTRESILEGDRAVFIIRVSIKQGNHFLRVYWGRTSYRSPESPDAVYDVYDPCTSIKSSWVLEGNMANQISSGEFGISLPITSTSACARIIQKLPYSLERSFIIEGQCYHDNFRDTMSYLSIGLCKKSINAAPSFGAYTLTFGCHFRGGDLNTPDTHVGYAYNYKDSALHQYLVDSNIVHNGTWIAFKYIGDLVSKKGVFSMVIDGTTYVYETPQSEIPLQNDTQYLMIQRMGNDANTSVAYIKNIRVRTYSLIEPMIVGSTTSHARKILWKRKSTDDFTLSAGEIGYCPANEEVRIGLTNNQPFKSGLELTSTNTDFGDLDI